MKRGAKEKLAKDLEADFKGLDSFYLLDYTGMTVAQSVELRKILRKNDFTFRVVKNRLALRALRGDFPSELKSYFEKPTAVAFAAQDPIRLARLLRDFSTQNRVLAFKGGLVEGRLVPPERFEEVCSLASREELLGKIGYMVAYPLIKLLRTWQAPLATLGRLLSQLKEKK